MGERSLCYVPSHRQSFYVPVSRDIEDRAILPALCNGNTQGFIQTPENSFLKSNLDTNVGRDLHVCQDSEFGGPAIFDDGITVTGVSTFEGPVNFDGAVSFTGAAGNVTFNNLTVLGVETANMLTVIGTARFLGPVIGVGGVQPVFENIFTINGASFQGNIMVLALTTPNQAFGSGATNTNPPAKSGTTLAAVGDVIQFPNTTPPLWRKVTVQISGGFDALAISQPFFVEIWGDNVITNNPGQLLNGTVALPFVSDPLTNTFGWHYTYYYPTTGNPIRSVNVRFAMSAAPASVNTVQGYVSVSQQ